MKILQRYWLGPLFLGVLALAAPPTATAQIMVPPNNGFNATIVLPSTIAAFYSGLNEGLEKTGEGLEALTDAKGKKFGKGVGSLDSLRPGTPVAVQYTVKGIQASADATGQMGQAGNVNEGTVAKVDRDNRRLTIKYANGSTETLRSDNTFSRHSSRVIVYYADQSGRRVAHFFKPAH
jgi:hypothetical protein